MDLRLHDHCTGNKIARVEETSGKAIVIVDDEMSFTDLLGRLLGEHFKAPILTFSNPLTALEALSRLDVGILVTDFYMPHVNGLDVIRKAADICPVAPPSLLITGHLFEYDEERMQMPHFKGIVPKPFRWQQLAVLIEQHWPADAPSPLREGAVSLNR
ncbi:MAG: response regulator [Rariglobus sp.]